MGWAINRKRDRKKGREAEYEFKDLVESNSKFKINLTQIEHIDAGGYGAFKMGPYIAGDANIFSEGSKEKLAHCEIKAKYPTNEGYYGIELYRISDDISIEKEYKIPVYYIIKNTKKKNRYFDSRDWIFAKFTDLWDSIKDKIELYRAWNEPIGYYSVNDQILRKMHQKRVKDNIIYLTEEEIMPYCTSTSSNNVNGTIKLYDKSYYAGQYGVKATLVYFRHSLFNELDFQTLTF